MSGLNGEELMRACAQLGDVVVDPRLWPEVMRTICAAVEAKGAMLLQSDVRTPDIPRTASLEDNAQTYFEQGWHTRDARAERGAPLMLRGATVLLDQDLYTAEEMRRNDFYADFLPSVGLQWFAGVGFQAGQARWVLSIQRNARQGPFYAEDKGLLAHLSPKLTEVANLSMAVGRATLAGVANALNLVGQAAVAIDRNGLVLDANRAAEKLFDQDIRVAWRRLILADVAAKRAYDAFLNRLRLLTDRSVLLAEPIVVRRPGRGPLVIRPLPIDGAARGPFLGARALLVVTESDRRPLPKSELLMKAYGLSRAEARLAAQLALGRSLENIAGEFGIALATARNQLKSVFAKTGTHRQSELVALLAKL